MQDIYKKEAIKAAKEAGKIQLRYFETGIAKKAKKDDSFVTKADIESTKAIRNILGKNFPDHTLKCEELGTTRKNSDYKWIIDPLDGTHNFIIDNPLFGVSIALKHKDEVILGVINMPVLGKMYHAQKGKGAYCNGKKINVSKMNRLDKSLFIFDSKLRSKTDVKMGIMRRLAEKTWRMRSYGVSVYNNLLVAEGKAEFNIDFDPKSWDIAAALLIVEEAGGIVTDLKGNSWNTRMESYLASNKFLHKKVLNVLKK